MTIRTLAPFTLTVYPEWLASQEAVIAENWLSGEAWNQKALKLITDVQSETRNSVAYVENGAGGYASVAALEPAWHRGHGQDSWGQRQNLLRSSEDLTNADEWNKGGITISDDGTTIGGFAAKKIIYPASSVIFSDGGISGVSGTHAVLSAFVARGNVDNLGTNHRFGLYDVTEASNIGYINFDYGTGETSVHSGSVIRHEAIEVEGGWRIFAVFPTIPGNLVNAYFGGVGGATNAGYAYLAAPQLEVGEYPSPYIPTNGAVGTRKADAPQLIPALRSDGLTYQPCIGWEAAGFDNSLSFVFAPNIDYLGASADRVVGAFGDDADNCIKAVLTSSDVLNLVVRNSGVDTVTKPVKTLTQTGTHIIGASFESGNILGDLREPDATHTAVSDSSTYTPPAFSKGYLACAIGGGENLNASPALKGYEVGPPMTAAELAAATLKYRNETA